MRSLTFTLFLGATEALPFYWLSQTIYSSLASDATIITDPDMQRGQFGRDRLAELDIKTMLQSARVFVSLSRSTRNAQAEMLLFVYRHEWEKVYPILYRRI